MIDDYDVEKLRNEIDTLRVEVATALDAARRADRRADEAARSVLWAILAIGLSVGIALTLIVLAVIPGGQL